MKTTYTPDIVLQELEILLEYLWQDEEWSYQQHIAEGTANHHIFLSMVLLRAWLNRQTPGTTHSQQEEE